MSKEFLLCPQKSSANVNKALVRDVWKVDPRITVSEILRILYVIGSLNRGGTESHVARVSSKLVERGYKVSILCLGETGVLAPILLKQGVKVISPWIERTSEYPKAFRVFALLANSLQLFCHCLFSRPTVTHMFLPEATIIAGFASWLTRSRIRIASRRSLNFYRLKRKCIGPLESLVLNHMVHGVLGNSRAVVEQLIDEGLDSSDIGLIYNGVPGNFDSTNRCSRRKDLLQSENDDCLILVIVANLIPYKGHKDLLRGLDQFKRKYSGDWRIYCLGYDSGILGNLRELVNELGLEDHVYWEGGVPNVKDYLVAADIGLLVSHEEGFSNAILEGMAAGLPMIVTGVGGNPEAVIDGENGIVIPHGSPEKIAEAILQLASSREMRSTFGANGQHRIEECFLLDDCVDRYESVYQGLTAGKKFGEFCGENFIPEINRSKA